MKERVNGTSGSENALRTMAKLTSAQSIELAFALIASLPNLGVGRGLVTADDVQPLGKTHKRKTSLETHWLLILS
jgi:hypothetical protein